MTTLIRASSLSELLDCPSRWEAKNIRKMHCPSSSAAHLGTAVHKSTAVYDASYIDGKGITVDEAVGALVDVIHKPEEPIEWDEMSAKDAENIGSALHRLYCRTITPTANYRAVEVKCNRLDITDLDIALSGTTDRVRNTADGAAISDIKTGKSAVHADGSVETKAHGMQLGVYELLAENVLGIPITGPAQIVGLQVAKTEKGQRVGVGTTSAARDVLLGTEEEPGVLQYAAGIIKSGSFYGNPRSQLCGAKYCPAFATCRFRA